LNEPAMPRTTIMSMKKGQRIVLTTPNGNYVLLVEQIRSKKEYQGISMKNSVMIIDECSEGGL